MSASVSDSSATTDGSLLWLRDWKLSVGSSGGEGVDLSNMAFNFSVEEVQMTSAFPATFTIFNPSQDIVSRLTKDLTTIYFEAGYRKPAHQYGKLFAGQIVYFKHGRQSATDTFVEIHAMQGDPAMNSAVVNTTLPAGHTQKDVVQALAAVLSPYGVGLGQITQLSDAQAPRGRVLYGMVSDVLRDVGQTANANAFIDRDGKLHMLKEDESLEAHTEAIPVLNSRTGMIGIPSQTLGGGVDVRSLLNPAIMPGTRIKLNNKDITEYTAVNASMLPRTMQQLTLSEFSLHADGLYTVWSVKHYGESRGNSWYSDITTQGIDPTKFGPSIPT